MTFSSFLFTSFQLFFIVMLGKNIRNFIMRFALSQLMGALVEFVFSHAYELLVATYLSIIGYEGP